MENPTNEIIETLEDVEKVFPAWHCWAGVIAGILYARRPLTSPPAVVRDVTVAGLVQQIRNWENQHR
jgi:hypothetical protein